jgi:hypothetical protein
MAGDSPRHNVGILSTFVEDDGDFVGLLSWQGLAPKSRCVWK